MQLAEGTQISLRGKVGSVYRSGPFGCELVWAEHCDVETGEMIAAISGRLSSEEIQRTLRCGSLKIVSLPDHLHVQPPQRAAAVAPRPKELMRAAWRECYVLAAQKMIDAGILQPYRADFVRHFAAISRNGLEEDSRRSSKAGKSKRAGQRIDVRMPPRCGETVWDWWNRVRAFGAGETLDNYRNSGRKGSRFTPEENALMQEVIGLRLTEERCSITSVCESVQARFRIQNNDLTKDDPAARELTVPGYDAVWNAIAQIAPLDHKIRTRGMDVAYRDLHTLGQGLQVERALQRVELDEYTVDLMVWLRLLKIDHLITPDEKMSLGLTGDPKRVIISAAIDVYTGAIVAMQIAPAGTMNLAVKTIEMIYLDKQSIASAAGTEHEWPMHGHPQTLVLDRASVNMSDEMYLRLAAAGITNFAVPARKPFLKPWVEGFFPTMGSKFLQQFTGRTFGNVVLKGENDPAERATLTLDEFLAWLVRWIVDVHHTSKPATIGRSAPLFGWQRAVAETPPLILNDESRLRKAFGDRSERKVSRKGLQVQGLHYIGPEIADWFLNESERTLEVWWWHRKIGRVEVLLPDGRWVTAHCSDPRWADKSYDDLAMFVAAENAEITRGQDARDRYRVDADERTHELSGLRGMLPLAPSKDDLARRTKEFSRYMLDPSAEPFQARDLFEDEVTPFQDEEDADGGHSSMPVPPLDGSEYGGNME